MASMNDVIKSAREANTQRLRRLQSFSRMLQNPAILAERINAQLAKEGHVELILSKRFATGGGSQGQPWAGLKPSTLKQRSRLGFAPGPTLVRSGALQRGAVEGKTIGGPDFIRHEFKDGAAPKYIGGGKARKQGKRLKTGGSTGQQFLVRGGRLSDYAGALFSKRPAYAPPTRDEVAPLMARRNTLMNEALRRMTQGESLTGFI